ncbi:MAG: tetratricopeptide repeat protein [Bacteroidota bacterium]
MNLNKNFTILFTAIVGLSTVVFAQDSKIDSLKTAVEKHKKNSKEQVSTLNKIANYYVSNYPDSIPIFADKAKQIATDINDEEGYAHSMKVLSYYYYLQGDIDKSIAALKEAQKIFEEKKNQKGLADVFNNFGIVYKNYGEYDKSIDHFETSLKINKELNDTLGVVKNYINIAGNHSYRGEYVKAKEYFQKSIELNERSVQDEMQLANAYNGLAIIFERQGELDEALINFERSKEMYVKLDDKSNLLIAYNNRANVMQQKGDHVSSIQSFQKALGYANKINNKRFQGILLNNIANNYLNLNDEKKALEYYEKSAEIIKDIDRNTYAAAISNAGIIYADYLDDFETALELFEEANQIHNEQNSYAEIASVLNKIGDIYFDKDQIDKAEKTYLEAQENIAKSPSKITEGFTLLGLSNVSERKNETESAIDYGERAMDNFQSAGAKLEISDTAQLLYKLYKKNGNQDKAFHYLESHSELSKELFNEEKSREIGRIEAEAEFKELAEKNRLKTENIILQKEVEIATKENYLIILSVSIGGLVLLIVFMFYLKHNRDKSNQKLRTSKERIELQNKKLRELQLQKNKLFSIISHDLRGPLTTLNTFFQEVESGEISSEELSYMLPEITKNLNNTVSLTDNLLKWASQSMEETTKSKETIKLHETVEKLRKLYSSALDEKNLALENNVSQDLLAKLNPNILDLVLRNLISNAIKFCNKDDSIRIDAQKRGEEIIICVDDTGIGMSQEKAAELFNKKLNSVLGTQQEKGTGIGLLLCKNYIEEHDGRIWVEESAPEKGSKICFSLPL